MKNATATLPALLATEAAVISAAGRIKGRAANLRESIHVALLSALAIAETTKRAAALDAVVSALAADLPLTRAVCGWIKANTCYSVRVIPATEKEPLRVQSAYVKPEDAAEHAPRHMASTDKGLAALHAAPYYAKQPKREAEEPEAFKVAMLVDKLSSEVEKRKLNARQRAALARLLQTYCATLDPATYAPADVKAEANAKAARVQTKRAAVTGKGKAPAAPAANAMTLAMDKARQNATGGAATANG